MNGRDDKELDRLFTVYRDSLPEIEPSADFMAAVWRKIEERRPVDWLAAVKIWSPRLAAASMLAATVLSLASWIPREAARQDEVLDKSYVDALTVDSLDEHDRALWILAGNR